MYHHEERGRFGSARFADDAEIRPHYKKKGVPLGYYHSKPLYFETSSPILLIAGSGSGKNTSSLARLCCEYTGRKVIYDPKGELTAQSMDTQAQYGIEQYVFNPYKIHNLPAHSVNPLSHLQADSKTLTADCALIAEGLIVSDSNDSDGGFFTNRGREWLAKLLEWLVLTDKTTDFIRFNRLINSIDGDINTWSKAIAQGEQHPREDIRRTFCEMFTKQSNSPKEFGGVMAVIYNSLCFMADENISHMLGGNDFNLSVICDVTKKANISLIVPAENMKTLQGLMRVILSVIALNKSRHVDTPKVLLILEEAAQLGRFSFLIDYILPYGRGAGLQPFMVFQDLGQIQRYYGHSGKQSFLANSEIRIFLGGGIRDPETAKYVSDCLGTQTLEYDDTLKQEDARRKKLHAVHAMLNGKDPLQNMYNIRYEAQAEYHPTKQHRPLMTTGEMLNMPRDRMLIFTGDKPPIYGQKFNFWERQELAGLYFSNPYHPPSDIVTVRTWYGSTKRKIIAADVPHKFRDYPQYQQGRKFRYVDGYKPPL